MIIFGGCFEIFKRSPQFFELSQLTIGRRGFIQNLKEKSDRIDLAYGVNGKLGKDSNMWG